MFCTKCGNQVEDSQQFCTKCGQQVDAADGSVRQQESAPKTKSTITAKIIEGVIFVAIAAAFFGYKYYTSGVSMEQLEGSSARLLKGALEDNDTLMKYCDVREVKDCVLVKDSGNTYRGTAKVVLAAKKPDGKGKRSMAALQFEFDFIYDGESDNAMLQNGKASDKTDLVTFLNLCMEDSEDENANEDNKEPENSTEESTAESDEDRTISSFLGFEFGKDINELCTQCWMDESKECVNGRAVAELKKPFRMFKSEDAMFFKACPTTKRMYELSISSAPIPDKAVRKREYEKCRDIIMEKYGIKPKESCEAFGVNPKSKFVVGNVTILLLDNSYSSALRLSATNTQLEKEAKEEYKASLPSGDDEDAL